MFEEEAEDNKPPYAFCALDTKCELWKDGFQKGAEFGYNKALAEANKNLKAVVADFNKAHELGERANQLLKDKGKLIDENNELKKQIEKMKCCGNCAKNGHICVAEEMQGNLCGKNKDKWELRR